VARTRQSGLWGFKWRSSLAQPERGSFSRGTRGFHSLQGRDRRFVPLLVRGEEVDLSKGRGLHGRGRCQNNPCEVHLNWDTKFSHERHLLRPTHFGLVLSEPPIFFILHFVNFPFFFFFFFSFFPYLISYYEFLVLENSWSPRVSPFSSSPPPRFRFHNVCLCPCDRNSLSNTLVVVRCPCMLIHPPGQPSFSRFEPLERRRMNAP
jgi:hypothetical protein